MTAIIVINYKNEEMTISFVKNELSKLSSDIKIVIVNNGADETSDKVLCDGLGAVLINDVNTSVETCDFYVISSPENLGFAKANNLAGQFAIRRLGAEYLLFSNNDIRIIDADIIERLESKYETSEKIGMIGPKVVGLSGDLQSPGPFVTFMDRYVLMYIATPFMSKEKKASRFNLDYQSKAKEGFHYKLSGCFFMMSSADFIACGMMDPNTFLYGEEMILAERLAKIRKAAYYLPDVSIVHAHGVTTHKELGSASINKFMCESECYYYHNYIGVPSWKLKFGIALYSILYQWKLKRQSR